MPKRSWVMVTRAQWFAMFHTPTWSIYRACSGSWESAGAADRMAELKRVMGEVMAVKRRRKIEGQPLAPYAAYDDLLEQCPAFAEFMTDASYEDGTNRPAPYVGLWCKQGAWHAKLKDDGEGLEIELAAPLLTELLKVVEGALLDPNAPWRGIRGWQAPDKSPKKKRG